MVKTAAFYLVPIKSYSKNTHPPFFLKRAIVTYTEKRDMQTKQEKEKKNKHHLRIEKKPPTKKKTKTSQCMAIKTKI